MKNYSTANLYSVASPVVGCNSWANVQISTSSNQVIRDNSGISSIVRESTGRFRVNFSNASLYGGGGYACFLTPEVKGNPLLINVVNNGSTAARSTSSFRFDIANISTSNGAPTFGDPDVNENVHVNLAVVALKTSTDLPRIPYQANFVRYSEDMTQFGLFSGGDGTIPVVVPNSAKNPVNGSMDADLVTFVIGSTASNSNMSFLNQNVSLASVVSKPQPFTNMKITWSFWARGVSGREILVLRGAAGGAYTEIPLTTEWYRYSGTENLDSSSASNNSFGPIQIGLRGTYPSASKSQLAASAYIWGVQVETGSVVSKYTKTEGTIPVIGSQDSRKSFVPGASGFGVTGATYNSHMMCALSKNSATAYGTIVIPKSRGSSTPVSAYIEGGYNISVGVSAGGNSVFDVTFVKPMNNTNYCVILTAENEPTAVSAASDFANIEEYSMLLIARDQKTVNGFRVLSLKQDPSDKKWKQQSIQYQKGLTERIHFMVFGGATYGQP